MCVCVCVCVCVTMSILQEGVCDTLVCINSTGQSSYLTLCLVLCNSVG